MIEQPSEKKKRKKGRKQRKERSEEEKQAVENVIEIEANKISLAFRECSLRGGDLDWLMDNNCECDIDSIL